MQRDFHHAVTYIAARSAGFEHEQSATIAYAAQYVDDATSSGVICFDNKALYTRISSAHRTLDPENLNDVKNHLVWLPFHFLPGNGGKPAGEDPKGTFIDKILCRPGTESSVAQDMLAATFQARSRPNALHRLGVTMHVYADTWAHQGFAGVLHDVNDVRHLEETGKPKVFKENFIEELLERMTPPLGHGCAKVFPDMPFLVWRYRNGRKEEIQRDNPTAFCTAADEMCKVMRRWLQGDFEAKASGIPQADMDRILGLFQKLRTDDETARHKAWLKALGEGTFSFGPVKLSYSDNGRDSWKAKALGTSADMHVYSYTPDFLRSDWKYFHDALQLHRLTLLHDILPKYGICAG